MILPKLSRRKFIQTSSLFASTAAMPVAASAKTAAKLFDRTDPVQNVKAAVKLMGDLSGKRTYFWNEGRIFGQPLQSTPRLLFRFEAASTSRFTKLEDGVYKRHILNVLFFKDPETNEILENWENPYTGATVKPIHYFIGPAEVILTPTGYMSEKAYREKGPSSGKAPFRWEWNQSGDRIWAVRDVFSVTPAQISPSMDPEAATGAIDQLTEFQTYEASAKQLHNPLVTAADSTMNMIARFDWYDWMLMASRPGSMILKSSGRKIIDISKLPAEFVEAVESRWPKALSAPEMAEKRSSAAEYRAERSSRFTSD